jgi:hypothetical protein
MKILCSHSNAVSACSSRPLPVCKGAPASSAAGWAATVCWCTPGCGHSDFAEWALPVCCAHQASNSSLNGYKLAVAIRYKWDLASPRKVSMSPNRATPIPGEARVSETLRGTEDTMALQVSEVSGTEKDSGARVAQNQRIERTDAAAAWSLERGWPPTPPPCPAAQPHR